MPRHLSVRVERGGGFIEQRLQKLLDSWTATPITGSLKVKGHDYWWILEYGSGEYFTQEDGTLTPPTEAVVKDTMSSAGESWEVLAHLQKIGLVHVQGHLKFKNKAGKFIYPIASYPTGQGASVGRIRRAIRFFDRALAADLKRMKKFKRVPYRYEIVALVNSHLEALLKMVQGGTPVGTGEKAGGHLRDAWRITHAR